MLKIRLKRFGRTHSPTYRVVVMKARTKRDGKTVEEVGFYNPMNKELKLEKDRIEHWLSVGAQPTYSVARMLVKEDILKDKDVPKKKYSKEPGEKSKERAEKKKEKANAEKEDKSEKPKE